MERFVKIAVALIIAAMCTLMLLMCVAGAYALAKWMIGA